MYGSRQWYSHVDTTTMVENTLTEEMIDSGKRLISKLDASGVQPNAAFWLYDAEAQTWKLVIAEIEVGKNGPKHEYHRIRQLLDQISGISLDDISLTTPDANVVQLLRSAVKTGSRITGIRLRNNAINGTLIGDAYVYRVA